VDASRPEVATDWDRGWTLEPLNPATVDEEAQTPRWKAQERLVLERFGSFEGLEVIEIGAGRGVNGALYGRRGARVTLLDVSELALSQAQELYAAHGLEPRLVKGDVFDLPQEVLGRFDVAMSFGLCEHFLAARRLAVVRAHLEPLRPGGLAFLGVPNRHAPVYRLWMASLKRTGSWPIGTEEPFTAAELARLAREAGGQPLAPAYGSFVGSVVNHGVNQVLFKLGRKGLRVPQTSVPGLDRMGYELLLPVVRPA
jgi:2-polyprenyl-3-methyl-5-hydroxy-6-metoxy-1,4-benzoquinol methylase